jgi:replicative DNA helicase
MYVSLEMGASQLIKKLISMMTNINGYIFRAGTLEDTHWDKIAQATSELSQLSLVIPDDTYNLQDLVSKIKKEYNANGLDIVFIDYLQLLKSRNKTQSREQEVAEISRTLKLLSLQLNIPVVALCQLNRLSASGNNEPTMAELRESGSLEQDADNVFLLYSSPNADQKVDDPMINVTLKIAKQRNGAWGKVNLLFQKQYSCFKAIN